ncbi:unnamed protein product [Trichobilharzia regenti]|nr:unnamed protein product [Trichobilharzia regenti]
MIGNPEVPFSVEKLREITITSVEDYKKWKLEPYMIFDMITSGRPGFKQYEDKFSLFLYLYTGADGIKNDHDKRTLFKTAEPIPMEAGSGDQVSKTIQGMFSGEKKVENLSNVLQKLSWQAAIDSTKTLTSGMLKSTILAFLGISARLAHRSSASRLEYWGSTALRHTLKGLLPEVEETLLDIMVNKAHENGLFDVMLQGSRWTTDHAFYVLCAKNSYSGRSEVGLYSFFLVGVLGYQYSAFGTLSNLSTKLEIKPVKISARICLKQSLEMMRMIKRRKSDLEETRYPWYLLCHSLQSGFDMNGRCLCSL